MRKVPKLSLSTRKFPKPIFQGPATELSPPPPPPPLQFEAIIARVFGADANIYTDIFGISPDASQEQIKEAYLRTWNQTHEELANCRCSKRRKQLVMRVNAISEAYQMVSDNQKKAVYDASIRLQVGCNNRMKEYLMNKDKEDGRRELTGEYDILPETHAQDKKVNIQDKKVKFSLDTAPSSSSEDKRQNLSIMSPTGVSEFDKSLYDDGMNDKISPIARLRRDNEQVNKDDTLVDVFASYLNLNNFIDMKDDDERSARSEEDDEYSTEDEIERNHDFLDLAEEYIEKTLLGLCR
jgi:curved DNA-binding protein CbpA